MKLHIAMILTLILGVTTSANRSDNTLFFLFEYLDIKYPDISFDDMIYVGIKRQELTYARDGKVIFTCKVSTSKVGAGNEYGSECTPIGLHEIKSKIGENVPVNGIFKSRIFTGKMANINMSDNSESDAITSRILTLNGLEYGINKGGAIDSYKRNIYLHGTPDEGLIGQPASHGCIRLKNNDIITLFELVRPGTKVVLLNN